MPDNVRYDNLNTHHCGGTGFVGHTSNMRSISRQGLAAETTASFPSPAQDYYDGQVSLDRHLIRRPASTFVLRLDSAALEPQGLFAGDELLVDRGIDPVPGRILVVLADDERRVGRFSIRSGRAVLVTGSDEIPLTRSVVPWGVVTFGIRHLLRDPPRLPS